MRITASGELRDRHIEVEAELCGAEPEVGIMSDWFEDEIIKDAVTGEVLEWELTDHECCIIMDWFDAKLEPDPDVAYDRWRENCSQAEWDELQGNLTGGKDER